jgi:hypothetical protein
MKIFPNKPKEGTEITKYSYAENNRIEAHLLDGVGE